MVRSAFIFIIFVILTTTMDNCRTDVRFDLDNVVQNNHDEHESVVVKLQVLEKFDSSISLEAEQF